MDGVKYAAAIGAVIGAGGTWLVASPGWMALGAPVGAAIGLGLYLLLQLILARPGV